MRRPGALGRLGGMVIARDRVMLSRYGRVLVLLALRNELRDRHAPAWRRERNRIEIDRAIAELARERSLSSSRVRASGRKHVTDP